MSFLRLSNIGKIYVSEGNVTVGIRGVNLSFERGEFVAITGASGSGKSTLLNVLSGMDTYEEGELYIEEQPTSHYLQPEWEEYREKYISFIFQNYNILESFTVLQNVELALMTITDPIERRKRAIELIERVGLKKHMRQKGSQLSGGQKQRTVIARALAKDSPIILADEPTGNLDAQTSREIIALLREVSKDKLLIMVTHSYDQVSEFATRHVRIFDGAVEADQTITEPEVKEYPKVEKDGKVSTISNGMLLGRSIFFAKPKLSLFLCLLLLIGTFGVFLITMFCGDASLLFEQNHMFRPMKGRLVIIQKDGNVITDEELNNLASKYNAERAVHYDYVFDVRLGDLTENAETSWYEYEMDKFENGNFYVTCGEDFGKPDVGRYPEKLNEVLLRVPIFYQQWYGVDSILLDTVKIGNINYTVTGVVYIADNTAERIALLTEEGYRALSVVFGAYSHGGIRLSSVTSNGEETDVKPYSVAIDPGMDPDKIYYSNPDLLELLNSGADVKATIYMGYGGAYVNYKNVAPAYEESGEYEELLEELLYGMNTPDDEEEDVDAYTLILGKDDFLTELPATAPMAAYDDGKERVDVCYIGLHVAERLCEQYYRDNYKQASLFFKNDRKAASVARDLKKDGYIATTSDMTYKSEMMEILGRVFGGFLYAIIWILGICFVAMFINMCANRTVGAFSEDIAIMRSMGIPVKVIRVGIYVRMMFSLLPSLILLPIAAWLIYHYPKWNGQLRYLQPWQYVVIIIGMFILTFRVTRKQIKNLFGTSVKKSLRGGEEE
ncbi:MAG: ATP-binding cassette domain-containing protein [Lachnospiraceae bacterium]|nr:ATP-binding cassette domain-containing protein [Lachnospiraceae bacterium]